MDSFGASRKTGSVLVFFLAACLALSAQPLAAKDLTFVGIHLNQGTTEADAALVDYLNAETGLRFARNEQDYADAIRTLSQWNDNKGPYVARMTPYAYVAAEMLGARFDVLATYESIATGSTIYHAYFVVNRQAFDAERTRVDERGEPTIDDLVSYLRRKKRNFGYHQKFSTSSYLVPALFFRSHHFFQMDESNHSLSAIDVERVKGGTDELVRRVAERMLDVAAIWDGAKTKAEAEYGHKVRFIQLDRILPNDLLVCSASLDSASKERISAAIGRMPNGKIKREDFDHWVDINKAPQARQALADLRRAAAEHPAPVTVSVQPVTESKLPVPDNVLEAVRQAIRLSSTELVLFDRDLYAHADVVWTLEAIHDNALILRSTIDGADTTDLDPQVFQISYMGMDDLTRRVGALIHSRMHRLRFVWPYEVNHPTVLRDVDFAIPVGAGLKVQKVTWSDPDRDDYRAGKFTDTRLEAFDFYKLQLGDGAFPKEGDDNHLAFNPMSNVAYRVILIRPSEEPMLFRALTAVFVGLLVVAGCGAAFGLRRRMQPAQAAPMPATDPFRDAYASAVSAYHDRWKDRQVAEANLLWCDRLRLEQYINELKTSGVSLAFDAVQRKVERRSIVAKLKLPWVDSGAQYDYELVRELATDPERVGDAQRVGSLIRFLLTEKQLSPFVGEPREWDALATVAYRAIFNGTTPNGNGNRPTDILREDDATLADFVSKHFGHVLDESLQTLSLFPGRWVTDHTDNHLALSCQIPLPGQLNLGNGTGRVRQLTLTLHLPATVDDPRIVNDSTFDAWLLGTINDRSVHDMGETRKLELHFRAIALLQDLND